MHCESFFFKGTVLRDFLYLKFRFLGEKNRNNYVQFFGLYVQQHVRGCKEKKISNFGSFY